MTAADHANTAKGIVSDYQDVISLPDVDRLLAALDALQTQAERNDWAKDEAGDFYEALKAAEAEATRAWEFEHKMMERAVDAEEKLEASERLQRMLSRTERATAQLSARVEAAEAERDRARDALRKIIDLPVHQDPVHIARAALGDDA